jgi:hypothetical protein
MDDIVKLLKDPLTDQQIAKILSSLVKLGKYKYLFDSDTYMLIGYQSR